MSLLEWAAKSRHESANDPVIVAVHLAFPGTASAGAGPPSPARIASPAAHTFRRVVVLARLMATSNGISCLDSSSAGGRLDPTPGLRRTREPSTGVGFGRVVTLD